MTQLCMKEAIEISLAAFNKAKEMIWFGIQLADAVNRGSIQPKHFEKNLTVPEPNSKTGFYFELDWTKHPDIFKSTADDALICIANYAIIMCKESYPSVLWVKEHEDGDLFSAQIILKLIRDSMGHIRTRSIGHAAPFWRVDKNLQKIYEIKKLNIIFDATNLHDKQLKFSQIGGITNIIRILDYLIGDLQSKVDKRTMKTS